MISNLHAEPHQLFSLSSRVTKSEAYRGYNEIVDFEFTKTAMASTILNVHPNPWVQQTSIQINILKAGNAEVSFYDLQGRLLHTIIKNFDRGSNTVVVQSDELDSQGVIYIKLKSKSGNAEYKMIKL